MSSVHEDVKNLYQRRKNLIFLIHRFLLDNALTVTAKQLTIEANLSDENELCDNVDLDSIYLDFANYFHLRFGKYPRILRKAKETTVKVNMKSKTAKRKLISATTSKTESNKNSDEKLENICVEKFPELEITVKKVETNNGNELKPEVLLPKEPLELVRLEEIEHADFSSSTGDHMINNSDWAALMELVKTTIFREDIKFEWSDMCGNSVCKNIIKEAVLAPIEFPQLFADDLKPWRSVLLHGPPGSGKTLLAKILYAETRRKVTFFNVSSSIIVSKWRGESEKILRVLFYLARRKAPSIIFLDEIEGLISRRDRAADHESSKRFKNELLQLLDGMEQLNKGVFILASTNLPWEIDEAFLRRFEKKLLVQLPNEVERAQLIGKLLPLSVVKMSQKQMESLVKLSENFTGDEIRLSCKEIAMQTVRQKMIQSKENLNGIWDLQLESAFKQIKPLSMKLMPKHVQWQKEHGC